MDQLAFCLTYSIGRRTGCGGRGPGGCIGVAGVSRNPDAIGSHPHHDDLWP